MNKETEDRVHGGTYSTMNKDARTCVGQVGMVVVGEEESGGAVGGEGREEVPRLHTHLGKTHFAPRSVSALTVMVGCHPHPSTPSPPPGVPHLPHLPQFFASLASPRSQMSWGSSLTVLAAVGRRH